MTICWTIIAVILSTGDWKCAAHLGNGRCLGDRTDGYDENTPSKGLRSTLVQGKEDVSMEVTGQLNWYEADEAHVFMPSQVLLEVQGEGE